MNKKNKPQTLPDRLVLVREHAGHNPSSFADELLEMNRSQYRKIEAGDGGLTADKMLLLAEKLHVNLHWLLTGEGDMYLHYKPTALKSAMKLFIQNWLHELHNPNPQDLDEAKAILKLLK